jgi:hypothetical protein
MEKTAGGIIEWISGRIYIHEATRSGRTAEWMVKVRTGMKCGNRLTEDTEGKVGNREGYTGGYAQIMVWGLEKLGNMWSELGGRNWGKVNHESGKRKIRNKRKMEN